jgi:RluA family pseudouridine synthase
MPCGWYCGTKLTTTMMRRTSLDARYLLRKGPAPREMSPLFFRDCAGAGQKSAIHGLSVITDDVVEAARSTLVIGATKRQIPLKKPHHLSLKVTVFLGFIRCKRVLQYQSQWRYLSAMLEMLVRFRGDRTFVRTTWIMRPACQGRSHHTRMRRLPGKDNRSGKQDRRKPGSSRELVVLYEDDAVVALYKPAGLNAVPVKGSEAQSAWSLLSAELKPSRQRAFVIHRIDRFTSGVLLFAKTEADRDALVRQFLHHTPVRQYLAVIRGHLAAKEGTLVHYFRREGMFQRSTPESDPKAARAELRYFTERRLRDASLVRVTLVTGLQNQIRVQFSAFGHPVIGDRKYHPVEASERRIARVALHATHLQFTHPRSGNGVSVHCEPPADFQSLLQALSLPARALR